MCVSDCLHSSTVDSSTDEALGNAEVSRGARGPDGLRAWLGTRLRRRQRPGHWI
jgi:hypothetical protein